MATPANSASNKEDSAHSIEQESAICHLRRQFSITQWYYQSLWWQQYMYWQGVLSSQLPAPPLSVNTSHNPLSHPYTTGQPHHQIHIRVVNGFETYITSTWRRVVAEMIDVLLVAFMLKWYYPDIDYRVPESLFLGADVILKMDDDELEEMGWTVLVFLISIVSQRLVHLVLETVCNHYFSATPGKLLMGLRIYRCNRVQYTRTDPGHSIKIQPGTRMTLLQSFLRALFKFISNMFCPLIIFFIVLDRGRTQYDRAFKCIIVNKRQLFRPVYNN